MRPEFQSLKEYDQNSSVSEDKARIPIFIKIGSVLQCLEEKDNNSKVWKNRARMPMFIKIGQEFQCLEG